MDIVNKRNASILRRYFIEYTVLALTLAVALLFRMYVMLNDKMMELQTNVIQKNTEANIELKQEIQNFKTFSR